MLQNESNKLSVSLPIPLVILDRCPHYTSGVIRLIEEHDCQVRASLYSLIDFDAWRTTYVTDETLILFIGPLLHSADSFTACRWVSAHHANLRVILISRHVEDPDFRADATSLGVHVLLSVESTTTELLEAIRLVWRGQTLARNKLSQSSVDRLTDCEMNVLKLLAKDKSHKQIAEELNISVNTVRNEAQRINNKLHVHSRQSAILRARRLGLL